MNLEPHRLPWSLALLGAIHGWALARATETGIAGAGFVSLARGLMLRRR